MTTAPLLIYGTAGNGPARYDHIMSPFECPENTSRGSSTSIWLGRALHVHPLHLGRFVIELWGEFAPSSYYVTPRPHNPASNGYTHAAWLHEAFQLYTSIELAIIAGTHLCREDDAWYAFSICQISEPIDNPSGIELRRLYTASVDDDTADSTHHQEMH